MMKVIDGDIVKIAADIIVNAANTQLIHSGGVAKSIAFAGGKAVEKESAQVGFCPLGDFVVTTAGNLAAKKIVHIPTIDYLNEDAKISYDILEKVWRSALAWSNGEGYRSVATPILGAGFAGLEQDICEQILTRVANEFPAMDIMIVRYF